MPRDGIGYERTVKKFCSCAHATSSMRMESVDDWHPPMFSKYNLVNNIGAQDLCVSYEKTRLTDSNKGNFEDKLRTHIINIAWLAWDCSHSGINVSSFLGGLFCPETK